MASIRTLPPEEYDRLKGLTGFNDYWIPDPGCSYIVVAEEGEKIVGFWVAQAVIHIEPVWIHKDYRKNIIAGRMWDTLKKFLVDTQTPVAYAFSISAEISDYLERLGLPKLPYSVHQFTAEDK